MFIPKPIYLFIIIGVGIIGLTEIILFITIHLADHKRKNKKNTKSNKNDTQ